MRLFPTLAALLLFQLSVLHAADAPQKSLPLPGVVFQVQGHTAFVILPPAQSTNRPIPWVWYAPTLPGLPGNEEQWMFERFNRAGVAIVGIDVGESCGSPDGRALYSALYEELTQHRGFAQKAVMLGRSRGGLMTLGWAAENAEKVAGFAGIYPVCNIASYPGVAKAAGAYHMTAEQLSTHLAEHNPIDRLAALAKAGVPLFAIHGDIDDAVPLNANSGEMRKRYEALGGKMQLIVPAGQGHNMWPGFFQCQELVDFVLTQAKRASRTLASPKEYQAVQRNPQNKPNILFILTDQQFADAMSCRMGNQYLNTPTMDRLAQSGMLFTRAYSPNPLCMPFRNSAFTGCYPHETGVTQNSGPEGGLDPKEFVCLGTYFRDAGYDTPYCGKWHLCYDAKDTQAHGFEIATGKRTGGHDAGVTDGAVQFLARRHDKPFLLVASFLNPHNVCEWARRLAGREQRLNCGEIGEPPPLAQLPPVPANLAPPQNEPDGMTLIRRGYQVDSGAFPVGNFTVEDWRKERWGYYRMIEKVDAEIGKVLAALRQAGLEDNTLIVFTADHGECAGAHGFNQKTVFYEESARIPLIIAGKGKTAGGRTDKLVNTGIDLLPTMLDFAGLAIPRKLPGRSLLPLALGKEVPEWRDHLVVQNNMSQTGVINGMQPTMEGRMVRSDRYKYCIYTRGQRRESLVDLQVDPGETSDLAADPKYRTVLLEHRELLARFGQEHNDPLVANLLADNVKPIPFTATSKK